MKNAMIFMALALFLAGCAVPFTPAPSPTSKPTATIPPTASSTPEPTLSPTPAPSKTPEPTLEPTLPFYFFLPSLTPTAGGTPAAELDCRLIAQSIVNGTEFHPKEPFSIDWQINNTGSAGWNPGNVDFLYVGGSKLFLSPLVHLPRSVAAGETVALNVEMRAPNKESDYTTFWSLRRGKDYFCRVGLTISVH